MRMVLPLLLATLALPLHADMTRYFVGNPDDVDPALQGPAFDLDGGGGSVDDAMQWTVDQVRGCTDCDVALDLVVLRASGSDAYNEWFGSIDGIDSIETFVIDDRASSFRPDVFEAVRAAEMVFFAGGDQCNYVKFFKGTPVHAAVESVVARGGGVGGTSAGLAIQGELIYDACPGGSTRSADALLDPWFWDIGLSTGLFDWQDLHDTITDSHFQQRDRLGRLLVFMALHLQTEPWQSELLGMGVNERTAVGVDRDGIAHVFGQGPVYFIRGSRQAETLAPQTPLTWCGIEYSVVPTGSAFDLRDRPAKMQGTMDVVEGVIVGKPY